MLRPEPATRLALPRRLAARIWPVTLVCAALLTLHPATAIAHPRLRRSTPAADDTLARAPAELRLTFSEPIELRFTRIMIMGRGGAPVPMGAVTRLPDSLGTVVVAIGRSLEPGEYVVGWQAAGDDGHVVRGHYRFLVTGGGNRPPPGGEAGGGVIAPGAAAAHDAHHPARAGTDDNAFDVSSPLFVGTRWLMYLALLGVIGAAVFEGAVLAIVRRRAAATSDHLGLLTPRVATIGRAAAGLLLLTLPVRLLFQSLAMHGPGEAFDPGLVTGMLGHTTWGWSWLAQLVGGAAALLAFQRARRADSRGWPLARLAAVGLAFTPAFAGHAIAAERWVPLAVIADGLHVLGAAGWLGTLGVLVAAGLSTAVRVPASDRGRVVADLVNAYSPIALIGAGTAAVTGGLAAWIHIGYFPDLWGTAYGRMLLLKLGILSVVAATGAYNWRWVRPSLGDDVGAARVRRSAMVEVIVAVFVLLVTAILVALPTPMGAR